MKIERWHPDAQIQTPLRWRKIRQVEIVCDLFHNHVPFGFIDQVFAVMTQAEQHTFQILTKRPQRMAEYLTERYPLNTRLCIARRADIRPHDLQWPLPNVWLGTSVENQEAADERIPHLLRCPAAVRWISVEPLLGLITLPFPLGIYPAPYPEDFEDDSEEGSDAWFKTQARAIIISRSFSGIDWVVVGGESGPKARPMQPEWARGIRDQCSEAGVPFFMKQLSSKDNRHYKDFDRFPPDLQIREYPRVERLTKQPR